jgi:hypothetical protein
MYIIADVFARAVFYRFMRAEQRAYLSVKAAFVGVQAALMRDVAGDDTSDRYLIGMGNMEGADVAAALH